MRQILILSIAFLVLAAGCIAPDARDPPGATRAASTSSAGTMTAEETRSDATSLCVEGLSVNGNTVYGPFCATRTVTVKGEMSLDRLPVSLRAFAGDVKVRSGAEGKWSFVAQLVARGSTPDDATAHLSDIAFSWSHGSDGAHALEILAKQNGSNSAGVSASIDLTLPASLVVDLAASSGSGDISVVDVPTSRLVLSAGSGKLSAKTIATEVALKTGSGDISAQLTPGGSGLWAISTGSGSSTIQVPETGDLGYDVTVSTGSGKSEIKLQDGSASACPSSGSCNHRTFQTNGFRERLVQTQLRVSAGSGDVSISAA